MAIMFIDITIKHNEIIVLITTIESYYINYLIFHIAKFMLRHTSSRINGSVGSAVTVN